MRVHVLWLGHARGRLYVGRRFWLLWESIGHLDVRLRVEPLEHEPAFAVRELWLAESSFEPPMDRITSSDLRDLPLGGLEKALQSPAYARAVVRGSGDPGAPELDPRLAEYAPARRAIRASEEIVLKPPGDSLRVDAGAGTRRSDDFYEQVMEAYGWAVAEHDRPAQAIADANEVPVSTVHRWMKEAKRRRAVRSSTGGAAFWAMIDEP